VIIIDFGLKECILIKMPSRLTTEEGRGEKRVVNFTTLRWEVDLGVDDYRRKETKKGRA
jgi:hypothetical protein